MHSTYYSTKEEFNIWLSTYHEAIRSPYTANMMHGSWNKKIIDFARECADEAVKEYQDRNIESQYNDDGSEHYG